MTTHHILALFIRIAALWLILVGVQAYGVATLVAKQLGISLWHGHLITPLLAIAAAILWLFPRTIADRLLRTTAGVFRKEASARALAATGSIIVGCSVIILVLPHLMVSYASGFMVHESGGSYFDINKTRLLVEITYFAIGFIFIAKPSLICIGIANPASKD